MADVHTVVVAGKGSLEVHQIAAMSVVVTVHVVIVAVGRDEELELAMGIHIEHKADHKVMEKCHCCRVELHPWAELVVECNDMMDFADSAVVPPSTHIAGYS